MARRSLALALIGAALACRPDARVTPPTPDGADLYGLVVNDRDDRPISEALVIVSCPCLPSHLETTTDAAGVYRVSLAAAGTYTITALVDERSTTRALLRRHDAPLRVDLVIDPQPTRRLREPNDRPLLSTTRSGTSLPVRAGMACEGDVVPAIPPLPFGWPSATWWDDLVPGS